MLIRDSRDCKEIIAGDVSILRELLHPDKQDVRLQYSLAYAIVKPHEKTMRHKLKASEVYYIIQGQGIMHIDDETSPVNSNQAVYIPPNALQYIENTGDSDLEFLCIVEPAWKQEDEEVLERP